MKSFPTIKIYQNGKESGTFDSEKFSMTVENLRKFAIGFVEPHEDKNLEVNKQKMFGKCLGR